MENDTKNLLMQYLGRIAEHYEIEDHASFTFKKRSELIELLKVKNEAAAAVVERLFSAFIKEDRITNDREKFDRARVLWESEHAAAEHEKVEAERLFIRFCGENKIPTGLNSLQD